MSEVTRSWADAMHPAGSSTKRSWTSSHWPAYRLRSAESSGRSSNDRTRLSRSKATWDRSGGVEGRRDVLEAERVEHALEHRAGVRLGPLRQAALPGGCADLVLGEGVHLLLAVRVRREEVADPVEETALLRED